MKNVFTTTVFVLICTVAFAQQRPHYTQYILNNYILNPALSGIENYTDVKMSARDQWVGLNGAPQTFYLTIQGPIGKKDYRTTATSYDVPGENPRGKNYWQS
ncbi:MAG TPA: type IX secretion system membrane protein PorP/SprF, partial [Chitinophagaceae bacterium]|nr:type IX secretion system membrane protein PorP/SprF [Chitinophagaceae bacterium]